MLARDLPPGLELRLNRAYLSLNSRWNAADFRDDGRLAWRVHVTNAGRVIPVPFVRQQDAIAAARAIGDVIDWESPEEEISHQLDAYGRHRLVRTMIEALAW